MILQHWKVNKGNGIFKKKKVGIVKVNPYI